MVRVLGLVGVLWGWSASSAMAQELRARVVDALTLSPIPYALVTDSPRRVGTHTNGQGWFWLASRPDTLHVSAPGYLPKEIIAFSTDSLEIQLSEKPLVLQTLSWAQDQKPTLELLGALRKRAVGYFFSCDSSSLDEMALLVPNPRKSQGVIKKASFYVARRGRPRTAFRVRLYQNKDGRPGDDILQESVIVRSRRWGRWKEVPLGRYNVPIPEDGFFISMEWLATAEGTFTERTHLHGGRVEENACRGPVLGTTDEFDECRWWYRTNGRTWHQWNCEVENLKKMQNPMIRLELLRYR
ncbi:hypothetical protein GCM10027275_05730 [Rhabdobacter roseus]|uniref:Carboxypeptidase-like regulatory domain-containing protein n=1 Tax=Rhabdobacter roseus TaxID=1655419 RepID=A0A840TMM1_9BACT|nr:hypothetical protein [Rhabdobacter roseus]MBB5282463.1 hypothetical protein [Rhabdobacter roseus]